MTEKTTERLRPGMGVDIVFNLSATTPIIKSTIIFDNNNNKIIVAQPRLKILKDFKYDTMHISSLLTEQFSIKSRKGYTCQITEFIDNYKLANGSLIPALELEINGPLIEMNIRSAFRFTPNSFFNVMGKLVYKGREFYSETHFKVNNISATGLGILIPKKIDKKNNPLIEIKKKVMAKTGLILKSNNDSGESIEAIGCNVLIVRSLRDYNPLSAFVGMAFKNMRKEDETALNRFIHNGQLHEIRSFNRF